MFGSIAEIFRTVFNTNTNIFGQKVSVQWLYHYNGNCVFIKCNILRNMALNVVCSVARGSQAYNIIIGQLHEP
jgi:hypothetical protein